MGYVVVKTATAEEFVAVLPETDIAGARCVAEKMRQAVETINLKGEKASLQGRLLSVSESPLMLRNTLRVIDEANKALYLAKLKAETGLFFPLKFFYEQYVLSSFFPFHSLPLLTNTPPYFKMHQYQKNEQVIMNLIL